MVTVFGSGQQAPRRVSTESAGSPCITSGRGQSMLGQVPESQEIRYPIIQTRGGVDYHPDGEAFRRAKESVAANRLERPPPGPVEEQSFFSRLFPSLVSA